MRLAPSLPFTTTTEEDAVEKYFCVPFEKLHKEPLSMDDAKLLLSFMFIKEDSENLNEIYKELNNPDQPSIAYQIFTQRFFKTYNFSMDKRLLCFFSIIMDTPGKTVMYGTYLAYWAKKNNTKIITMDDFSIRIFPFGMPSEKSLSELWDKQKVIVPQGTISTGNLLDFVVASQSLIQN